MIIALVGESGAGKSVIEKELATNYGFEKIISYTTREPRKDEENGKDYYFSNNETFKTMLEDNLFAEWEEYSQNRLYGTLKMDYVDGDKVVVLTPNGVRQLKRNCKTDNIIIIYVTASLGTRIKRYIDRCGVDDFNYSDKEEICSRVDRDFGMFLGVERMADLTIVTSDKTNVEDSIKQILTYVKFSGKEN